METIYVPPGATERGNVLAKATAIYCCSLCREPIFWNRRSGEPVALCLNCTQILNVSFNAKRTFLTQVNIAPCSNFSRHVEKDEQNEDAWVRIEHIAKHNFPFGDLLYFDLIEACFHCPDPLAHLECPSPVAGFSRHCNNVFIRLSMPLPDTLNALRAARRAYFAEHLGVVP